MDASLTITLDEEVVRNAKRVAEDRQTSLDDLVAGYLRHLAGDANHRQDASSRLDEIFRIMRVGVGPRSWTREELHERR